MRFGIVLEKIDNCDYPNGYYAHIPSMGLTTHGDGINGAISAAKDFAQLWIDEKRANNEMFLCSPNNYQN